MKAPSIKQLGIIVLIIGLFAFFIIKSQLPEQIEIVKPTHGKAIEAVYATGIVDAVDVARVGAQSAGRIVQVLVDVGDEVKEGQVLALMDDEKGVQRKKDADARLLMAEQEQQRQATLLKRGFATQQTVQKADTELQQAKAAADVANKDMKDMAIMAPIDGTIIKRDVDTGQSTPANTALFNISSTKKLRIVSDVDERDIPRVKVGTRVAAKSEAFIGEVFESKVDVIRPVGDSATRTYRVDSYLPDNTKLMAGMTVDVNIVLSQRDDAMLVPSGALVREKPQGGELGNAYLWVVRNGKLARQPVDVGAISPEKAEIKKGIDDNDLIALKPDKKWVDGKIVSGKEVSGEQKKLNVFDPPTP